ncbi:MAG: LysR family transcriptional regulator [Pseudomonadota bacterium]
MDTLTRMRTFLQVADAGGFTAAAKTAGRSKALVSKYVSELEDDLGVRLLNRTTRQLSLTEAGEIYYREAAEILERLDTLTLEVQDTNAALRGRLKVSVPRTMGDGAVGEAIVNFAKAYPEIEISILLEDRFVNLVEEGFDAAIRVADLPDSSLIARKVGSFEIISVASPDVIAAHGRPDVPADLADKPCIIDANARPRASWTYFKDDERFAVTVRGRVEFNSPHAVRRAALSGLGFARIPRVFVRKDLKAGTLVEVLSGYKDQERSVHIVYPHRRHLPSRTRAFVDYMVDWYSKNSIENEIGGC